MSVSSAAASPKVEDARRRLGRVGVALMGPTTPAEVWRRELARVEKLGYTSAWTNEPPPALGSAEVFARTGVMLSATGRMVVGAGIASMWARQPSVMHGGAAILADAYPGRFVLGLGVGMKALVEQGGQIFDRPLARMREYLDKMDAAADAAPRPAIPFARVLAALGPKMVELAGECADGVFPAAMPVEHTAAARQALGPDKLLVPVLAAYLDDDRDRARAQAREAPMLRMPGSPYVRSYQRLGFSDDDLAGGGSDRFLDAVGALGDERAVAARVQEHLDAGADHVVVTQPAAADLPGAVDQLERLAPSLVS